MPETRLVDLTELDMFRTGDHHAVFAELRRKASVHWNHTGEGSGFWALTRYGDIIEAYRDHETYSSTNGVIMGGSYRNPVDTSSGRMLVATDLPRHRMLRQHIQSVFAPRFLTAARQQAHRLVHQALNRLVAEGGGDFASDVAVELATGALMALLRIGHQDARHLVALTRRMTNFRQPGLVNGDQDDERLLLAATQAEIFAFFDDLVEERRHAPGDDLVGILLSAEVSGRPLARQDILYNCLNVAVGGNETSSHTAAAGLNALMERPDRYAQLLRSPALLPTAVDEILRFTATAAYVQRTATRDVTVRGRLIRAGDTVTLWNVSGNRDAEQFPNPDDLVLDRRPNRHLSYGSGLHRCVGAALGQVEVSIVFDQIVERGLTLVPAAPVEWFASNFILGVSSLPVVVAHQYAQG
ncbi:cytochrome P450 [Micromonospora sp. NPDC049051]|uniref:cytochrome P450 n=1 Tax=Micromonospora sp. NPDC049051 TaxID=3364264 RepID=UPI00371E70EF